MPSWFPGPERISHSLKVLSIWAASAISGPRKKNSSTDLIKSSNTLSWLISSVLDLKMDPWNSKLGLTSVLQAPLDVVLGKASLIFFQRPIFSCVLERYLKIKGSGKLQPCQISLHLLQLSGKKQFETILQDVVS